MNKQIIEQLGRVQAELQAIKARVVQEARDIRDDEQALFEQLQDVREVLLGNIFFCSP